MAMLTGAAMMCLTISSCSNDDNAVDIDGDVPNVGVATVKNSFFCIFSCAFQEFILSLHISYL